MMDASAISIKRRRWRVTRLTGALLISSALFNSGVASGSEQPVVEFQVKSAYLYNLPKFVRWPDATFTNSQNTLTICVIGHEDMRDYLYRLDDRPATGHVLKVSYRNSDTGLDGCQMVYFGGDSPVQTISLLKWCHQNNILTIGDQPGFVEQGGIIGFALIDERIRLVINRTAARSSGLQISAKLLELAKVVD